MYIHGIYTNEWNAGWPNLIWAVLLWEESPYHQTAGSFGNLVSEVGCGEVLTACASTEDKGGVVTPQFTEKRCRVYVSLGKVGKERGGQGVKV